METSGYFGLSRTQSHNGRLGIMHRDSLEIQARCYANVGFSPILDCPRSQRSADRYQIVSDTIAA